MAGQSAHKNTIIFGENAYRKLNEFINQNQGNKVFVLCDENTQQHCVAHLFQKLSSPIDAELIEIESGEAHKNLETCQLLWETLSDLGGDRQSVLINLGGGIITDMGGFVASTFLRGIRFINIPTTLLGMVDAAIGGKTGVNRKHLKNQIGLFRFPVFTCIDIQFLATLPQNQLKSGLAEMLKHGLIADAAYWKKLNELGQLHLGDLQGLIITDIAIKTAVV